MAIMTQKHRSNGVSHGKAISRGKAIKALQSRVLDMGSQLQRSASEVQKVTKLYDVITKYDDLVKAVMNIIPQDLNITHGPTRRLMVAQMSALRVEARGLGVALHAD